MAIADNLRRKKRNSVTFDDHLFLKKVEEMFDDLPYSDYIYIRGRRIANNDVGFISDIRDKHFSGGNSGITITNEYFLDAVRMLLLEKFAVYRLNTWCVYVCLENLGNLDNIPQITRI